MAEGVKSAARVLALLELFDRHQRPMTLREIVAQTGFPQSSTAALLATMIQKGYVAHDRRSCEYVPTPQVAYLGCWVGDDGVAAEPALKRVVTLLHRTTGETAVAAVRRGIYAQYIIVQQKARPTVVQTQAGVLRPLCTSGTGVALLSMLPDAQIRKLVLQAARERRGLARPVPLAQVRRAVQDVRRYGFAVSRHGVFEGTGMVAVPVATPIRGHGVALGVGGPVPRIDAKLAVIVRELRELEQTILGPV